jgi:hypothetical protein
MFTENGPAILTVVHLVVQVDFIPVGGGRRGGERRRRRRKRKTESSTYV